MIKIFTSKFLFTVFLAFVNITVSAQKLEVKGTVHDKVFVDPAADGVLRILAIGNSFSADALETHFAGIAQAAGVPVIISNMAIGGAPLDLHVSNWENNANAYLHTRIGVDGQVTKTTDASLEAVLTSERWDFISLQQVSHNSGLYETFQSNLPKLHGYIKAKANRSAKFVLHQTWAYADNSTHPGFANYNNNQQQMYNAIVDTYNRASELIDVDIIIPAGTAIQNARTSVLNDSFTSDGFHLTSGLGRYIAATTWFEKLTGVNVIGNTYRPQGLTTFQLKLAQHAAHSAVLKPNEVTELTEFQQLGSGGSFQDSFLIDFVTGGPAHGWNDVIIVQTD